VCHGASGLRTERVLAVYPASPTDQDSSSTELLGPRSSKSLLNTFPFNQEDISDIRIGAAGDSFQEYGSPSTVNRGVAREPVSRYSLRRQQQQQRAGSAESVTDETIDTEEEEAGGDEAKTTTFDEDASVTIDTFTNPGQPSGNPDDFSLPDTSDNEVDTSLTGLAAAAASTADKAGRKCVKKVMMVEETVYDDVVECDHSYDRQCHTSYTTTFEAQQQEECTENYRKNCFINYDQIAFNTTVQICRTPLVKDCDARGEQICRTEYESECSTRQHEHAVEDDVVSCETFQDVKCEPVTVGYTTQEKCHKWPREECSVTKKLVKKYSPVTNCVKVPRELCAPAGCGVKAGPEECYDKIKTIIQDKPSEECNIEPQRLCKHVTKLVPKLEPKEECVDVPKEICSRSRRRPRKVQKPIIKLWCYVPSKESGLA